MREIDCSMFRCCEDDERVYYYLKHANKGNVIAMRELGEFYRFGRSGLKPDFKQAFKWFFKAAGFGDIKATLYVAESYRDGIGVEVNIAEAISLYKKAFNDDDEEESPNRAKAAFGIAKIYSDGIGVEINGIEAISWLKEIFSDNRNHKLDRQKAASQIAKIYCGTEQDGYSAIKWLKKIILLGKNDINFRIAEIEFKIAEIYRDGIGMPQNAEQAIFQFENILNNKTFDIDQRAQAAFEIAKIYRDGIGIEQNGKMAIKWFKLAAEVGSRTFKRTAFRSIAFIYLNGFDTSPNVGNFIKWLMKAAEAGDRKAAFFISDLFRDGNLVNQDAEKAIAWLNGYATSCYDSVSQVEALRKIAYIYKNGMGIESDPNKADELYELAFSISKDYINNIHHLQS